MRSGQFILYLFIAHRAIVLAYHVGKIIPQIADLHLVARCVSLLTCPTTTKEIPA